MTTWQPCGTEEAIWVQSARSFQSTGGKRIEDSLLRDERDRALYRCLEKIPADYREALYLVYIEGMSYEKAGVIMRKTRKQVDHLVERGKKAMRPLLAEEGVSHEID